MAREDYSMARPSHPEARYLVLAIVVSLGFYGCGSSGGEQPKPTILRADQVVSVLKGLPFRYRVSGHPPPAGDVAAFVGVAKRNGIVMRFSIGLGNPPHAVPVGEVGISRASDMPNFGFAFNNDAEFGRRFKSVAEWHAAGHMATLIEERLCKKASGKPCPV